MFCKNCGSKLSEDAIYCGNCGTAIHEVPNTVTDNSSRFLPSFILGLIGSIFAFLGGACTAACTGRDAAMFLIMFGGVVGMIGACKCLNKIKKGAIIELVAALMIFVCFFITGSEYMGMLGFLFLLCAGIIGLIYSKFKK